MAKELGSRRIAVNTMAPGAIQTDFSGGMVRDNPDIARHIAEVTALGRPGLPDDIGPMIASLLSEDNRWVNAQRIEVSGSQAISMGRSTNGMPQCYRQDTSRRLRVILPDTVVGNCLTKRTSFRPIQRPRTSWTRAAISSAEGAHSASG